MPVQDLKQIGQYEVRGVLGRGGMAVVYRAYQPNLHREVAVKVILGRYSDDPAFVARFQREAQAIASLHHPNILTIYEYGQDGDFTFIVTELLTGNTLRDRLEKPMPLADAAHFISQIASALDYAHKRGIIHRDVKPPNILLDEHDRAVLSDFGIAKILEENDGLTGTGISVGTPDYMSPEQASGDPLDGRCDQYSLGVVAYEMIAGVKPFSGETPISVVLGHINKPLPDPRQFNPNIKPEVIAVLEKVLAKKPENRFANCIEFARAFEWAISYQGQDETTASVNQTNLPRKTYKIDSPPPPCPYQGLAAFHSENAQFFYGRDAVTNRLIEMARVKPLVAVVGPSGSGKSSVVFAGLIPQLQAQSPRLIVSFRPGDRPYRSLASAIIPHLLENLNEIDRLLEINKLASALWEHQITLPQLIIRLLQKYRTPQNMLRVALVIDQFEEVFTLCQDSQERQQFIDEVLSAVWANLPNHRPDFNVVLTLRADFFGYALSYRPLADVLQDADFKLGPMNRTELQAAIEQPALKQGVEIEDGLVERILDAVGDEPGDLPLLEFALTRMWDKQSYRKLTHAAYEEIGGIEDALTKHADEVFERLSETEQKVAQRIFVQMVRPGEGTEDTRRVATRSEIGEENWSLVRELADARLVVSGHNEAKNEDTVEVIHEALIRRWQRLRDWMAADREFRMWQERLRVTVRQWETIKRDDGGLLRGVALAEAEEWLQQRSGELSGLEREFIEASSGLRKREVNSRDRLRRRITLGLVVASAVLLLISVIALVEWFRANEQRDKATQQEQIALSRQLAAQAITNYSTKEDLGLLLSLEAVHIANNSESTGSLLSGLAYNPNLQTFLRGHKDRVLTLALSPDGKTLASGGLDKTIILWDLASHKTIAQLTGHTNNINSVAFSPDGKLLASASDDKTVIIWDLVTHKAVATLTNHTDKVNSVAFGPDGKLLASASTDKTIILWSVPNFKPVFTLAKHSDSVNSVAFSPDGKLLASGSADHTIILWDVTTGDSILSPLTGHTSSVTGVAFSPNGERLASSSWDNSVIVWDVATGKKLGSFTDNKTPLWAVRFSPDGTVVAAAGSNGSVLMWNPYNGTSLGQLSGHRDVVYDLEYSADGKQLYTASGDRSLGIWSATPSKAWGTMLPNVPADIWSTALSPDAKTLAEGDASGNIFLFDTSTGQSTSTTLTGLKGLVSSVAFSTDGTKVVAGDSNGQVAWWDFSKHQTKTTPTDQHQTLVWAVAMSPDNKFVASGGDSHTVVIWDAATGTALRTLDGYTSGIHSMAFSPDSKTLVAGDEDGNTIMWDVATGKQIATLLPKAVEVSSLVFSHNGKYLAASSYDPRDKAVRVWNIANNETTAQNFDTNGDLTYSLQFSPDDKYLVAGGEKLVQTFDVASGKNLGQYQVPPATASYLATWALQYSADGKNILAASRDATLRILDATTLKLVSQPLSARHSQVSGLAFSADSKSLIVANNDNSVNTWNLQGTTPVSITTLMASQPITAMVVTKNGKVLALGAEDESFDLWDVSTGKQTIQFPMKPITEATSVAFSFDGSLLAIGDDKGTVNLWSTATGKQVNQPLTGHSKAVTSLAFSPDGKYLAAGSDDFTIILWDVASGKPVGQPLSGHTDSVSSLAFSPDGKELASGSADKTIIIWDVATGKQSGSSLAEHTDKITGLAFSPDGKELASSSVDKTVILWDLTLRQRIGAPLTGFTGNINNVAFSPDGKSLAAGDASNNIYVWNLDLADWETQACSIANRNLTQDEWQRFVGDAPYEKTCANLPTVVQDFAQNAAE